MQTEAASRFAILVSAMSSASLLLLLAPPAQACPECSNAEIERGLVLGVGVSAMVAAVAPLAANDVFSRDGSKKPGYGTVAGISGGAALLTVGATAVSFHALQSSQHPYVVSHELTSMEVVAWMVPPLVVGTLAAAVTTFVLRVPEDRPHVAFAFVPMPSGAAGMLSYSY